MENEVLRVVYCSRISKGRSAQAVATDLTDILLWSKKENLTHDVTGVLVTNQGAYSQVLEGPSVNIKNLIGHIACDQRHTEFKIIGQQTSDSRLFQEWSMAMISTEKDPEADERLFPSFGGRSNEVAVHAYCSFLRRYLLKARTL